MKVVITGGTGQLGRALGASLVRDGHAVVTTSRNPAAQQSAVPAGMKVVGWDARTADGWGAEVDGADAVVNLVGESLAGTTFLPQRWTPTRKELIIESRLAGGNAVLAALEAASIKPNVLIQSSAIGYYGQKAIGEQTEASPAGDDFMANICVNWEASTQRAGSLGVRRVVCRTGLPLDAREGVLPRIILPFKLFAGGKIGSGDQFYSWIHIEDWIRAIRYLIDNNGASGPYNLTAPNPATNAEMSRSIGRVMGRPSFLPVPAFAMKLAFGEVSTTVLDGPNVIPQKLVNEGFEFGFPELEPALKDLIQHSQGDTHE